MADLLTTQALGRRYLRQRNPDASVQRPPRTIRRREHADAAAIANLVDVVEHLDLPCVLETLTTLKRRSAPAQSATRATKFRLNYNYSIAKICPRLRIVPLGLLCAAT